MPFRSVLSVSLQFGRTVMQLEITKTLIRSPSLIPNHHEMARCPFGNSGCLSCDRDMRPDFSGDFPSRDFGEYVNSLWMNSRHGKGER